MVEEMEVVDDWKGWRFDFHKHCIEGKREKKMTYIHEES